ncbi:ABC transporter ATP-binding protein [Shewanella algae]|uniref:ABC transporter ATP-binding protein n=1 Tax=Shewanella algae TaxID=38313 RepID=UPI000F42001D|nr:ABC transporter ATP-binding protein [Shewanella algae]AYV14494.1 ABC transporter ATP-binding protein [Shewanella algae]QTE87889.1 ABC transporter ATP-binding protein [Shewanella algae]
MTQQPSKGSLAPLLFADNIAFHYGEREVLTSVSVDVFAGEVLALLGPNGTGKSTLLKLLLGLTKPSRGTLGIGGTPLTQMSRRTIAGHIAYVPQHHTCPFPYTVRQIVAMGRFHHRGLLGRSSQRDTLMVEQVLQHLRIDHLAGRPYTQISGGERQLALVGRALVQGANILMLDEPASALDFGHQARLLAELRQLADDGYAVVMTTHHPHHARMIADRALLLKSGVVKEVGTPAEVLTPAAIQQLYDLSEQELAAFTRGMEVV